MQITVRKKDLVILLVILFVGAGAVPSTGMHILEKESSIVSYDGSILYVGGSGLNNYTTIQSAVDVSVDGDTVFVYDDSSPYSENVMVNKSIDLIGENKETTIIDGNEINHTVGFFADGINIREFTLRHSEELDEEFMCILFVGSNNNTISDIIFICKPFRRETAIMLLNSSRNLIIHCIINDNYDRGIELRNSHYNDISENVINGLIWKRGIGISVIDSSNNLIKRNEFRKNSCCVNLHELSNLTTNNQIIQNNFLSYVFLL